MVSHRAPRGGQGAGAEREGEGLAGDEAGERGRGEAGERGRGEAGERGRGEAGDGFVCYFRSGVLFREGKEGLRRGATSSDLFPKKGPSTTSGTVDSWQTRTEAGRPGWRFSPMSR